MRFQFPKNFVWGSATSSYQIEGATNEDGRGPANWDAFCALPGRTHNGESGRRACDHYHRYADDIEIMKWISLKAYRFSFAWPRLQPTGNGKFNDKGFDFYDRLIDGLLAAGIQPTGTCYHWDMPLELERAGGWESRETCYRFADYCAELARRFGDRIPTWATINEPEVVLSAGHRHGVHPPGKKLPVKGVNQVTHHLLLAHGLGIAALRANAPKEIEAGIVHNSNSSEPLHETKADIDATRERYRRDNGWLLQPLFQGSYPEDLWSEFGPDVPDVTDGDLETIAAPIDLLGLNTYFSGRAVSAELGEKEYEEFFPRTMMKWPVTPDVLYWTLRFTHELYKPKAMAITENGCAYPDQVTDDGKGGRAVLDFARAQFFREYLKGVHRAADEGIPITGYYAWSFLDNFEWTGGYQYRFGLVHVNYETMERTPKLSAHQYRHIIANNGFA